LIQEARERKDHEMVLEVIEQNEYAVRLYQQCGFQIVRRLIGFQRERAIETATDSLEEIDLLTVGRLVSQYGLADLPWQLAGEAVAHLNPPARAYRRDQAYIVISNPEAEHIAISSLLVEPSARGKSMGAEMIKSVIAHYPGKTWHVPAILPEELGKVFEQTEFEREELSQWQMRLEL